MWFDFGGSFWVNENDFKSMIDDVKRGSSIDRAFDNWRITLDDEDYQNAVYVALAIKKELRKRLDA